MKKSSLRLVVVGAGSIGSRHIRNIAHLGAAVSVYRYRQDRKDDLRLFGENVDVVHSVEEALDTMPDAVVIANRTDQHVKTALAAARKGLNLFIEKPLSHSMAGLAELGELIRKRDLVVEIGCMMRFHPNLLAIKKILDEKVIGRPYFARAVVGQYLPDWRSHSDYRASYSAHREQGGGVVLDLVHELDLMVWWFGRVQEVAAMLGFTSDLEINSESIAQMSLRFESGLLAQVHMDYLRPSYHRSIEIVGSKGRLSWEDGRGTVTLTVRGAKPRIMSRVPKGFLRNDLFLSHMRHFFSRLRDKKVTKAVPFEDGLHVQRIALAAHRSSSDRKFVQPEALSPTFSISEG